MWLAVTFKGFFCVAAVALFALAAKAAPSTEAVIAEVGTALDTGDATQARKLADGALAENDLSALQRGRLLMDRGLAHEILDAREDAMADFTAALQTHALPADERAQVLLQRGFLLDGMNQLNDAAKDYGAAIALKGPTLATALNNRANVWRRQGKLVEARRDYQAALAAGTARPQYPYFGLGQIAEAQNDKDAARGFYAKAVAADPSYSLASARLAELGGPPDGAVATAEKIVLRPPKAMTAATDPVPEPAADKPAAPEKPIVLKPPPKRVPASAPVAPKADAGFKAAPVTKRAPKPASGLGLRPALDGPGEATAGPEVQLGAWRSEPEAQEGWSKARRKAGAVLDGMAAHIVRAELPGRGIYFRLRVSAANPAKLCADLQAVDLDCVRVRN